MRFVRFNAVGGLGIVVQLTVIWLLTGVTQTPVALATALGVAAAVVNNFVWHRQWTWRDRLDDSGSTSAAFTRFALANGMVSLIGNVAVMSALVPLANMFGYVNQLRSFTQGRAQYSMQFSHYDEVPQNVADEVKAKLA